jgi:hypothetical protein
MSSYIVSLFSKVPKKSLPLNPHAADSEGDSFDDFQPDFSVLNSPASSSSSSTEPSLTTGVLPKTGRRKAIREQRLGKAIRYGTAFMKFATSTAAGHFAPGSGGLLNVPGILSTASHMANVQPLLDEVCDINQPQLCQGLIAYVLSQKDRKLDDALLKSTPLLGSVVAAKDKLHGIDKSISGAGGEDRLAQARALVDHAKVCHVALALYAELVYGNLTSKENFRKALKDVDNDLEWGLSDEEPVEVAVRKVTAKLRPVL